MNAIRLFHARDTTSSYGTKEKSEMVYAINYDLNQPGKDYDGLHKAIKALGDWWHFLGSTWLVDSSLTAEGIWLRLKGHVDSNDHMLIVGVTSDYSGWLPAKGWEWIREHKKAAA